MKKILILTFVLSSIYAFSAVNIDLRHGQNRLGVVERVIKSKKIAIIRGNDGKKYKVNFNKVFSNLSQEDDKSGVKVGSAVLFVKVNATR